MNFPTIDEFRSWLQRKGRYVPVGEACNLYSCPLATYLNEHGALNTAYVRPDAVAAESCWRTNAGRSGGALPQWANSFALALDMDLGPMIRPVLPRKALSILDETVKGS